MAASSRIVSVASLKQGDVKNSLRVRATRIWDGMNNKTNTIVQTNIILMDKEDNHILAIVRQYNRHLLQFLEEGAVYDISDFKVVPAPPQWKTVRGSVAISFGLNTTIVKQPDAGGIPKHKFELMPFRDIPTRVDHITQLLDIAGCLKSMSEMETVGKGLRKMDILLANESGEEAAIVFWEGNADFFMKEYSKHKDSHCVIVVVTSVVVKQYMGQNRIATTPGSKIYINVDSKEVNQLRQNLQSSADSETTVQLLPARVQETYEERISRNRITISQLLSATIPSGQDFSVFTCQATIVDIIGGLGWYYNACVKCFKKMKTSSTALYCDSCDGFPELYNQRFKVLARVRDASAEAIFVLFNSDTERLLGLSVDQVLREHNQAENVESVPPILRNLQGMTRIFQLKVTSFNTEKSSEEFTVTRVFEPEQKGQKRSLIMLADNGAGDGSGPSGVKKNIKIERD